MSEQLLGALPGERQDFIRLVVRRKIIGARWEFPVGMKLCGSQEGRSWRVWPPGHEHAFICGVPHWYVGRDRPRLLFGRDYEVHVESFEDGVLGWFHARYMTANARLFGWKWEIVDPAFKREEGVNVIDWRKLTDC